MLPQGDRKKGPQQVVGFLDPRFLQPLPLIQLVDIALISQIVDDLGEIKRQEAGMPGAADQLRRIEEVTVDGWAGVAGRLSVTERILTEAKVATRLFQGFSNMEIQAFFRAPVIINNRLLDHWLSQRDEIRNDKLDRTLLVKMLLGLILFLCFERTQGVLLASQPATIAYTSTNTTYAYMPDSPCAGMVTKGYSPIEVIFY